MTLLGKILTVLIFIMSIVFMSLSLMVFATHKNWKNIVSNTTPGQTAGLVQQLEKKTSEVENLNNQLGRLKDQYASEQVARTYALSALSTKLTQLEQQLQQRETELTNLQVRIPNRRRRSKRSKRTIIGCWRKSRSCARACAWLRTIATLSS